MKDKKKMYEIPESEDIKVQIEMNYLATGASGDVPPIHGGDDPNDLPSGDVES